MWGPHSVGCFAHVDKAQLPRFYSAAIDAFTMKWDGDVNWWAPPIHLVGWVLRHAKVCCAVGSLVVPMENCTILAINMP